MVKICFDATTCCHSWSLIQKKGKILQIPLWQGGVHEANKKVWSLRSKLEVFIWRPVVYVLKSSTTFRGILICVIFRPRDMQEYYLLFGIFTGDTGLYSLSVFYIPWADFQYTHVYLFCVLHLLEGCVMESPLYKHRPHLYLWCNLS